MPTSANDDPAPHEGHGQPTPDNTHGEAEHDRDGGGQELIARLMRSVRSSPEHAEHAATEERFSRPGADRLGDTTLARVAARTTGAPAAAFFDLDKTIIARSSTLLLGRSFYRDGLFGPTVLLRGLYAGIVYELVGASHGRMEQMRHAVLALSRGWEADRVRRIVRETMEQTVAPQVYAEALDLIDRHRRAGRDVWVVSSAGEEIVVPLAELLGIDDVIATRSGLDEDGCYDGTLEFYAYGPNKATAIRQIASVRGYDLDQCFCYSDSITDLPVLAAVGNAVAVNPDRELRAAARSMQWPVRDFRSPVSLRQRLPELTSLRQRSSEVMVAGLGTLAAAFFVWRYVLRGGD